VYFTYVDYVNFFNGETAPSGSRPPHCRSYMITLRHSTLDRTPLDEWSARRRNLYRTTHNTHSRQTSIHPVEIKPKIPASKWSQSHAVDNEASGMVNRNLIKKS